MNTPQNTQPGEVPGKPLNFVLAFAQAVVYRLTANNARLPILPSGKAFNVEYVFIGTLPAQGTTLQQLLNPPNGSGPIYLDGTLKEFTSLIGEFSIENVDATLSLNVYLASPTAQTQILTDVLPPGAGVNEQDRELHPNVMYLRCATANTPMSIRVKAWCYGSGQ